MKAGTLVSISSSGLEVPAFVFVTVAEIAWASVGSISVNFVWKRSAASLLRRALCGAVRGVFAHKCGRYSRELQ